MEFSEAQKIINEAPFEDPAIEVENEVGKLLNMNPNNLDARIDHAQTKGEVIVSTKDGFNVLRKLDKIAGKRFPGWEITGFQADGILGRGQSRANVKIILVPLKK